MLIDQLAYSDDANSATMAVLNMLIHWQHMLLCVLPNEIPIILTSHPLSQP